MKLMRLIGFSLLMAALSLSAGCTAAETPQPKPETPPSFELTASDEANLSDAQEPVSGDYVSPDSSTRKLGDEDLYAIPAEQLPLARNEIPARHGYVFKTAALQTYFDGKAWYKKDSAFSYDALNSVEKYNMALLKFYESMNTPSCPPNPAPSGIELYKPGQEAKVDLNGDGNEETILWSREESHSVLKVNDQSIEDDGDCFSETFGIADIDPSDGKKEIILSDLGPSDDYSSTFYSYDGKAIGRMGQTGGLADYGIVLDGKGRFLAMARGNILQTWFFNRSYELDSSHRIKEVKKDIYPTDAPVFVKQPVQLFSERSLSKPAFKLSEGSSVRITATDDRQWCRIETENGKTGWFAVKDFDILSAEGIPASEAFFGLSNAD